MCVFCAAVPAAAVTGMILNRKYIEKRGRKTLCLIKRPFLVITMLAILVLISLSIFIHSRQ
jgi:hypothetical protein